MHGLWRFSLSSFVAWLARLSLSYLFRGWLYSWWESFIDGEFSVLATVFLPVWAEKLPHVFPTISRLGESLVELCCEELISSETRSALSIWLENCKDSLRCFPSHINQRNFPRFATFRLVSKDLGVSYFGVSRLTPWVKLTNKHGPKISRALQHSRGFL